MSPLRLQLAINRLQRFAAAHKDSGLAAVIKSKVLALCKQLRRMQEEDNATE